MTLACTLITPNYIILDDPDGNVVENVVGATDIRFQTAVALEPQHGLKRLCSFALTADSDEVLQHRLRAYRERRLFVSPKHYDARKKILVAQVRVARTERTSDDDE